MPTEQGDFHYPNALKGTRNEFDKKLEKAYNYVKEDGLTLPEAANLAFGIYPKRWYYWVNEAVEDMKAGFNARESRLIRTVLYLTKADAEHRRRFTKKANEVALDDENPSVEMLKFILERRHGYKKQQQQEVEVSAKDDLSFNINIVESSPKSDE